MIYAFIQARVNSTRLPNKIFKTICNKPILQHIIDRISYSNINNIIVSTTTNILDDITYNWCIDNNINVFRGDENNVLKRFYDTAIYFNLSDNEIIIRITADDPLKDPYIINQVINLLCYNRLDFAYNNNPPSFPEGLDVEVFTVKTLKDTYNNATSDFDKEHLTQYMYRNESYKKMNYVNPYRHESYKKMNYVNPYTNNSNLRLTLDTDKDFEFISVIYNHLYKDNKLFTYSDIIKLLENENIPLINSNVKRSFMYETNK